MIGKKEWIAMFDELGLSEVQMMKWHSIFEKKYPDAHQKFLEWLGIAPNEIESIRVSSN